MRKVTRRLRTGILLAAAASLVAACSGGGNAPAQQPVPAGTPTPKPTTQRHGTLRVAITIPKKASARKRALRRPAYVSASTQSLSIAINGGAPVAYNVTPGSPNCSTTQPVTCAFEQATDAGTQTVAIVTYDQPNASGNILSQNTVSATIAPGQVNTIPITLTGVIASLGLALTNAQIQQGTSGTDTLGVNAYDADGNLIVEPGDYDPPVTITDGDQSGGTTLTVSDNGSTSSPATTAAVSDPAALVTVNYNGQPLSAANFGASSGSIATTGAQNAQLTFTGAVTHVIIVIQENRTPDNLFNGLPGADTATSGLTSQGTMVPLQPIDLNAPYDLAHQHAAFVKEYDNGGMDDFDKENVSCPHCTAPTDAAYGYVPQSEAQPYWTLAETYAFADRMFQTNAGPSYPAHLYLVSGTAAIDSTNVLYAQDNAIQPGGVQNAGCDSPSGTLGTLINPATGDESQSAFPCVDHKVLFDSLDAAGITWRYYQAYAGAGLWFAPDAISHIRNGPDFSNVSIPQTNVINDIQSGNLPGVSWVTPTAAESDHAGQTDGSGPSWIAQIVNAVGGSQYWNNTAIFVTWDDWGGWYDHVSPPQYNYYELGFRVPLIAISPYSKSGYVSHVQHEFGSILKFTEQTFGLGTLGYTDVRADNLSDMFNFGQTPLQFSPIQASAVSRRSATDRRNPDKD
jgi:phospholipase C